MTQLKDGDRQPRNREERSLSASPVVVRRQGNGWDEPCKLRGLRTVLWAAGGEIPPADPAAWNPELLPNGVTDDRSPINLTTFTEVAIGQERSVPELYCRLRLCL